MRQPIFAPRGLERLIVFAITVAVLYAMTYYLGPYIWNLLEAPTDWLGYWNIPLLVLMLGGPYLIGYLIERKRRAGSRRDRSTRPALCTIAA